MWDRSWCAMWDFPGGLVVKTLCSQCRGHGFDPWSGIKHDPACHVAWPENSVTWSYWERDTVWSWRGRQKSDHGDLESHIKKTWYFILLGVGSYWKVLTVDNKMIYIPLDHKIQIVKASFSEEERINTEIRSWGLSLRESFSLGRERSQPRGRGVFREAGKVSWKSMKENGSPKSLVNIVKCWKDCEKEWSLKKMSIDFIEGNHFERVTSIENNEAIGNWVETTHLRIY